MYKAIEYFTDNLDNGFAYNVGDVYPREGYTPTEERIQELATADNVRRRPVIVAVEEAEPVAEVTEETAEEPEEEAPEEVKPKRKRKKAE